MLSPAQLRDTTQDVFLGGKLLIRQPLKGYRAGLDAVLLAAAVNSEELTGGRVLDAGAGVGTVGLCLAARLPQARVVLLERQAELAALAEANVQENGFAGRVSVVTADIANPAQALSAAGVADESFALALANPPFHDRERGTAPGNALKAQSHHMEEAGLEVWARFLARMVEPGGGILTIHKAEALPRLLQALDGRFGALRITPIHSRAGEPAIRVLVAGTKGSRAPLALAPAVVLHGPEQAFLPEIEAVLRAGAPLFRGSAA